jgi:hypothetical protein
MLRNGTLIERWAWGSRVRLPDGAVVLGAPQHTDDYYATANRLGYGDDVVGMARDHDPAHAALCDWLGMADSVALRISAGLGGDPVTASAEEDAVLSLQRFCKLAGVKLFVDCG